MNNQNDHLRDANTKIVHYFQFLLQVYFAFYNAEESSLWDKRGLHTVRYPHTYLCDLFYTMHQRWNQ